MYNKLWLLDVLLLQSLQMKPWLAGGPLASEVTAPQRVMNWEGWNSLRPPIVHSLHFWPMARLSLGALHPGVATQIQFNLSWGMSSESIAINMHLPQSGLMKRWWRGETGSMVEGAQLLKRPFALYRRFTPQIWHSLRSWQIDPWWRGVMLRVVETPPQFNISYAMWKRFMPHALLLLCSDWMVRLLHGEIPMMVETVLWSRTDFEMCNKLEPLIMRSPQSWATEQLLLGVTIALEEIVVKFNTSSAMCSKFIPHFGPSLQFWQMGEWWHGEIRALVAMAVI